MSPTMKTLGSCLAYYALWCVTAMSFELSHHLDALFAIFVNYTIPVSTTLEACKQMNYVSFVVFCDDLGIDEYLAAYFFLISS